MQFQISDSNAMHDFGQRLGQALVGGDIVVLDGPLGAGKTTLVQGIGLGLDVAGSITSPTFVVSRIHRAGERGIGLIHVDAYRLKTATDLLDMEVDDQPNSVLVLEWGRPFVEALSSRWLDVSIARDDYGSDEDPASGQRTLVINSHGPDWDHVLKALS